MKTSVIVPVFNKISLTADFLGQHWQLYPTHKDVELVIVNNGSTDSTEDVLSYWKARMGVALRIVHSPGNLGFSGGNNLGVKSATGDILVFLSNDVHIRGQYIEPFVKVIEEEGVDNLYGAQFIGFDTGWNKFRDKSNEEVLIPYLAGWCVACTKKTFESLGRWNEDYFPCDYEDIELSHIATQQGRDLIEVLLPLSHLFGQTAGAMDRPKITAKSRQLFMEKWELTDA